MSTNQLKRFSKYWFVMALIILLLGLGFFIYEPVVVTNIGAIEFANSLETFNNEVNKPKTTVNFIYNILYDFIFILAYSILFYLAYRVFQISMRIKVSNVLILICFLPGLFDVFENLLMLQLLECSESTGLFNALWVVVRTKWTLVIPFTIINMMISIYYLLRFINSFVK